MAEKIEENLDIITNFVAEAKAYQFQHVVHIGIGGSSLTPLVFQRTFGQAKDGLPLTVLDSTDPTTILDIERKAPIAKTLFIAASKSGTTAEEIALNECFYGKVKAINGRLLRKVQLRI